VLNCQSLACESEARPHGPCTVAVERDDVVVDKEDRTRTDRRSLHYITTALHWPELKAIKAGLSRHINTMASIEALYIFDEHKYVSSLAINLHALAHLSDHAAATSS
jgi:hypothetical protein